MSKKELAIGVLGAGGNIGHTHSQNIATYVDGARLAAVYDLNTERAEEVAKTYGAKVMASAEELIASPEIDAVVIASWDGTHADLAVKCIEAGKPVFCEKPLATTLEDAKKVVEAEKASGKRLLQIGFMRRFDPDYIKMKKILDSGELGAPLMAHCISRTRSHPKNHTTEQHITNIAIHEIDICRWLLGENLNEVAVRFPRATCFAEGTCQDPQLVLMQSDSGVLIDVEDQPFRSCLSGRAAVLGRLPAGQDRRSGPGCRGRLRGLQDLRRADQGTDHRSVGKGRGIIPPQMVYSRGGNRCETAPVDIKKVILPGNMIPTDNLSNRRKER